MPYYVYVIELDKEVIKSKKFRLQNPNMNVRKKCFYVGQTCHEPNIRFKQHKDGGRLSNNFVKTYGLWLRKRIYRKYNPILTREKALTLEEELTEKLRKKGHGV